MPINKMMLATVYDTFIYSFIHSSYFIFYFILFYKNHDKTQANKQCTEIDNTQNIYTRSNNR